MDCFNCLICFTPLLLQEFGLLIAFKLFSLFSSFYSMSGDAFFFTGIKLVKVNSRCSSLRLEIYLFMAFTSDNKLESFSLTLRRFSVCISVNLFI